MTANNRARLDLTSKLNDIERRLQSLEAKILTMASKKDTQFDPRLLGERGGVRY